MSMILKSIGHEVVAACDGQEGVEAIQPDPNAFDVLITDNLMPRLSGIQLVEKLRAMNIRLKVILITGFPAILTDGLKSRLQLNGVLIKPFKPAQMLAALRDIGC